MFTEIVARKANDLIAISYHGGERKMGLGPSAKKFLQSCLFHARKMPFLATKGYFRSFAENGSGLEPQDLPLVARLDMVATIVLSVFLLSYDRNLGLRNYRRSSNRSPSNDPLPCSYKLVKSPPLT